MKAATSAAIAVAAASSILWLKVASAYQRLSGSSGTEHIHLQIFHIGAEQVLKAPGLPNLDCKELDLCNHVAPITFLYEWSVPTNSINDNHGFSFTPIAMLAWLQ